MPCRLYTSPIVPEMPWSFVTETFDRDGILDTIRGSAERDRVWRMTGSFRKPIIYVHHEGDVYESSPNTPWKSQGVDWITDWQSESASWAWRRDMIATYAPIETLVNVGIQVLCGNRSIRPETILRQLAGIDGRTQLRPLEKIRSFDDAVIAIATLGGATEQRLSAQSALSQLWSYALNRQSTPANGDEILSLVTPDVLLPRIPLHPIS